MKGVKKIRLSYSKIRDFESCPKKFYFTYIKKIKSPPNKYMIIGTEVHDLLYRSVFQDNWEEWLHKNGKPEYEVMINNYIEFNKQVIKLTGRKRPLFAEKKIYNAEYDFSLVIDRVDLFNDKLLITDYKTDSTPKKGKHMKQLLLYAFFFEKEYPQFNVTHVAPLYVKKEVVSKPVIVTPESKKSVVEWMLMYKKDIENRGKDENNFPAKPSRMCFWCPHYLSKACKEGVEYLDNKNFVEFGGDNIEL